jgi:hypothetical protein
MNVDRPFATITSSVIHVPSWSDLPPSQAGLAAALRRAFEMPTDETARKFDELLRRLS